MSRRGIRMLVSLTYDADQPVSPPVLGGVAAASADGVVLFAGNSPFFGERELAARISQTYKGGRYCVDFVKDE